MIEKNKKILDIVNNAELELKNEFEKIKLDYENLKKIIIK